MLTFASLLAEGLFHFIAEDYKGSIEMYNALIICLNRRSLQKQKDYRSAKFTMVGGDVTTKDNHDSAKIKVLLFQALAHRLEAYLALLKFKNTFADVTAALVLYPHFYNHL